MFMVPKQLAKLPSSNTCSFMCGRGKTSSKRLFISTWRTVRHPPRYCTQSERSL